MSGSDGPRDRSPVKGGVGSSGGQILSGIGSLASGLRLGAGAVGDTGSIVDPKVDLTSFINGAIGSGSQKDSIRRVKERRKESVDLVPGKEKEGVVGGSLKLLWSGRVADIVRMRETDADLSCGTATGGTGGGTGTHERDKERDKDRGKRQRLPAHVASDGELDNLMDKEKGKKTYDGRSTEEESDSFPVIPEHSGPFSGVWGGRVRGKLGNWAGYVNRCFQMYYYSNSGWRRLARKKHQSVDLTSITSSRASSVIKLKEPITPQVQSRSLNRLVIGGGASHSGVGSVDMSRQASSTSHASGAQSPTLPPMVFSLYVTFFLKEFLVYHLFAVDRDGDRDIEDDDLLSSGQVSPLSKSVFSFSAK